MATEPFFGDPAAQAPVFGKYAVLLGSLTATVPTSSDHAGAADFTLNDPPTTTTEWDPVGSLDDATPFDGGSESIDATDHTAAGFGVYATTYANQKETRQFTALETRLVTLGLIYDNTSVTSASGVVSGVLKRRDPSKQFLIAFYRENANGLMERYISKNYAYINSVTRNFANNSASVTVEVVIVPTSSDELYDYYKGAKS